MNAPAASPSASACVSEKRLWQLLMDMAAYGATAGGGVNRQALSVEDTAAKKHVVRWATERGFTTFQDDIGNLFVRRDGTEPALAPVMTGSHLDSQPTVRDDVRLDPRLYPHDPDFEVQLKDPSFRS